MTMIDRVARAIYEADEPWHTAFPWPNLGADGYRRAARAAIEAMREPTPRMVADALPLTGRHCDPRTTRLAEEALFFLEGPAMPKKAHEAGMETAQTLIGDWYTMIDAALSHEEA